MYERARRAQERGRRLSEEDPATRRGPERWSRMCARNSRASPGAVGTHRTGGRTRVGASVAERVRETLREKPTGERGTPWRLQTVSDKIRCGSNDALSASSTTLNLPARSSLSSCSASDHSRLPPIRIAMSVCPQFSPFKQSSLIHPVAVSLTVMTPCNVVLHPRT